MRLRHALLSNVRGIPSQRQRDGRAFGDAASNEASDCREISMEVGGNGKSFGAENAQ